MFNDRPDPFSLYTPKTIQLGELLQHDGFSNRFDVRGSALQGRTKHPPNVDDPNTQMLSTIVSACELLCESEFTPLELVPVSAQYSRVAWTSDGSLVESALQKDPWLIASEYPVHQFAPFAQVFLNWRMDVHALLAGGVNSVRPNQHQCSMLHLARLEFCKIRDELRDPVVRSAQHSFTRNATEKFRDLLSDLENLRGHTPRVWSLRFDLHLGPGGQPFLHQNPNAWDHELMRISYLRSRFHDAVKNLLGDGLSGYAWTIEYGRHRGFHVHYWILVDPAFSLSDVELVRKFEEKWQKLTSGLGGTYSCNEHSGYLYRAVGLVDLRQLNTIRGIQRIAAYLTLADLYVKIYRGRGIRTFGKGGFATRREGSIAGYLPPIKCSVSDAICSGGMKFI